MFESGITTSIIGNEEINDIIKIHKWLDDETIKNEAKEQKGGFPRMLLDVLGATSLAKIYETNAGVSVYGESPFNF